ncbi:MAG: hypothetical protein JXQ90_12435 [Cyclobacteriaceae bacterium]
MIGRISILGLFWIVSSCVQDPVIYEGPYYVQFSESTLIAVESDSDIIQIPVHFNGPALADRDITVFYSVDGNAREGVDYEILGERGRVIIPEDEHTGNVEIRLINNANNILRSQEVILSLVAASPGSVRVGQNENGPNKTFTLTIEDDCILGGRYKGNKEGDPVVEKNLYIFSNDCEEYVLTNWDLNGFTFFGTRPLFFIDNNDNTLTVPEQEDPTLPEDLATIEGFGIVNPTTGDITFNIDLVDVDTSYVINLTRD